jgi:stringent starvation protein B
MAETSTKPYMLRALHEWCTDNGYTPQIVVQVDANTLVPRAHVRDGQITLNIGALATNRLVIGNEAIEFQARFNGATEHLYVPIAAVSAIFARETGAGMGFEVEASMPEESTSDIDSQLASDLDLLPEPESQQPADKTRPKLSIVK